jgi:hypothetical protein
MRILEDENDEDVNDSNSTEILLDTIVKVDEDNISVSSTSSVSSYLWKWQVLSP